MDLILILRSLKIRSDLRGQQLILFQLHLKLYVASARIKMGACVKM